MKSNVIGVIATSIVIGLGGFMIGKITSGEGELSEEDRLLENSEKLIHQRSFSSDGENTSRARQPRGKSITDQKLAKVEEIARCENVLERGRAMLEWIDSLTLEEFEAASARLRSLDLTNFQMDEYAMMLLTAWAEADPISALAHAEEIYSKGASRQLTSRETDSGYRYGYRNRNVRWHYPISNEATSTVLSTWASSDPEAAMAWAKSNHQGEEGNPHMLGIILGLSESDPARATALLQEIPIGNVRDGAVQAMVPHLLKMGSESAQKWIAELSDDNLRQTALALFTVAQARKDPDNAERNFQLDK